MDFSQYTNKSIEEVFLKLKASKLGLSKKEAVLRQEKYGLNEVQSKGISVWEILLRQFKSPFFYLLVIAGFIAFFIGEEIDSLVILVSVGLNVAIGFFQEFKAERAVSLLKNFVPQKTKVLREGKEEIIEKKYLVPGDTVLLVQGDIVPAELRVINAKGALIDESVLTGESVPVIKTGEALPKEEKEIFKSSNILFTGTSIISGKVQGIVISTADDTAIGKIIKLVEEKRPQSSYEKDLIYFCRLVLRIVVITMMVVFLLNIIIKGGADIFVFLLFCVALIVSILPEALPTVVVFALSRGSLRMAHENVVVKRLSAIEDLGNIEILCTDKTGTLTQNKLSLEKIISSNKEKTMLYGLLEASDASEAGLAGSPVSGNLEKSSNNLNYFAAAIFQRADYRMRQEQKKFTIIKDLPFDSFRMCSSVLVRDRSGKKILITKGAPEVMLKKCSKFLGNQTKSEIKEAIVREAQDGKRAMLITYKAFDKPASALSAQAGGGETISKADERGLTFLGYAIFEDALKTTTPEAVRLAKKLGVQIKIITGDAREVAGFVAHKIGLIANAQNVILGEELEKMHQEEFDNACEDNAVFARISPDIKHKIIKSLQKKFEVGFLGEGINDVPALKIANVGIAVSEATDISKEAADVVLLKKDLRVIINGIKDGRSIFSNINKYIRATLTSNFGNFYSVAVIALFIPFLPMLPVQILLGNLLTDFPLISIVTDSVDVEELRKPKMFQLHNMLPLVISLGLVSTVFDFIFFFIFYKSIPSNMQTLWFIMSILTELLLIFIIRTRYVFWKAKKPSFTLISLTIIAGVVSLILPFTKFGQNFFHFTNIPLSGVLIVVTLVIFYIALSELVKLVYFHYFKMQRINNINH